MQAPTLCRGCWAPAWTVCTATIGSYFQILQYFTAVRPCRPLGNQMLDHHCRSRILALNVGYA